MASIPMEPIRKQVKLPSGVDENGTRFFYDITTKNLSFLQTASDLKKLGIKNNMFFLKLYDRNLVGVDPFSPALSKDQLSRIALECAMNPYYFIRECIRVPTQGGATGPGAGDMFILHRGNLAALYCFDSCIDFYLVIPRQCYKTWSILAYILWAYLFGTTNSTFNFSNKDQPAADDNLKKMKALKEALPIWMQQKFRLVTDERTEEIKLEKGIDNIRRVSNPITKNTIDTKPSARTLSAAENIGRGNSAPLQFYDEVEFSEYIGVILKASGPAYSRAAENCEKNGAIHCRMLTSTPGNLETEPVREMNEYRDNAALFTEKMYDKTHAEFVQFVKLNSTNSFIYIEFNYKQIGQDEKWFNKLCEFLNQDKMRIKREVLLQRIRGSSNSPFDPEDLDIINSYRTNPIEEYLIRDYFNLRVYRQLDKEVPYLVGVDVATGVNGDNTAITIIDPYDLKPCAHLKTPLSDEIQTSEILADIVTNFVPKAVLCIERNNIGSAVINLLRRTKLVTNLYNDPNKIYVPDPDDKLDKKGRLVREAESRRYWGIYTRGDNRQIMMDILQLRARENKADFVCAEIIDDMNNLIQKSNGKIEAASGQHDDSIMSYLIALYVYRYGVKLSRYGIYKGMSRQKFEEIANEADDYATIYESLPEHLKEIFPKPEGEQLARTASSNMDMPAEIADGIRQSGSDEELYRQIRAAEARRLNNKKITITENNELAIEDEDAIEAMIRKSDNRGGFRDIPSAIFDFCDTFND